MMIARWQVDERMDAARACAKVMGIKIRFMVATSRGIVVEDTHGHYWKLRDLTSYRNGVEFEKIDLINREEATALAAMGAFGTLPEVESEVADYTPHSLVVIEEADRPKPKWWQR